jgi:hypothetical protein
MQGDKLPTLFSAFTESLVGVENALAQDGFALTGPWGPVRSQPDLPRDQIRDCHGETLLAAALAENG